MTLYHSEVTSTRLPDLVEEIIKHQMHKALTPFSLKIVFCFHLKNGKVWMCMC